MPIAETELELHRRALTGHCYRMLGSAADADDAVQEALSRAWQRREQLEQPSALKAWLYRIATNVCLDLLADRKRRGRPMDSAAGTPHDEMTQRDAAEWLEPIPEAAVLPDDADPHERALLRERTRLAFVAALQQLPPKQRAAFLLVELVGCSAAETADALDTSVASVNSALQRARAKLPAADPDAGGELSDEQRALLERYVTAFESFDPDALTALLCEDATYSMPPYELWLEGPEHVREWLGKWPGNTCVGSRLLPVRAAGAPAFGQYRPNERGGFDPWALIVLELRGDRIAGYNIFLDTDTLFPRFDLPASLS